MDKETIIAVSKDISSGLRDSIMKGIRSRTLTYALTITSILGAFQNIMPQSTQQEKNTITVMMKNIDSKNWGDISEKERITYLDQWIKLLFDDILKQMDGLLKAEKWEEAKEIPIFFKSIASGIKSSQNKKLCDALDKMIYDAEHDLTEFNNALKAADHIKHNTIDSASVQQVNAGYWATFTATGKNPDEAKAKAKIGLLKYIQDNNFKVSFEKTGFAEKDGISYYVDEKDNAFIATAVSNRVENFKK